MTVDDIADEIENWSMQYQRGGAWFLIYSIGELPPEWEAIGVFWRDQRRAMFKDKVQAAAAFRRMRADGVMGLLA